MTTKERRRSPRRPIFETFSLFVVAPKKGPHKLIVRDVSDLGIGFEIDAEGDKVGNFEIKPGDRLDVLLYLNQSLALPLKIVVARIAQQNPDTPRLVGGELIETHTAAYQAFIAFVRLLDALNVLEQLAQAFQGVVLTLNR